MLQANKLFCWKLKQFSKFSVALVAPCLGARMGLEYSPEIRPMPIGIGVYVFGGY